MVPANRNFRIQTPYCSLARLTITLTLAIFLWPQLATSAQPEKQLRVTVIAVTEFDDAQLRNSVLTDAIKQTTAKLEEFFTAQFGVVPTVLRTREETTGEALRHWLFYDLSRDSPQTIHLVFMLTHGIGYQYSGATIFKNELFLASSDTKSEDFFGVAIRGSELIDAFQRLTRGSSVFLFLDTCGSGSIQNSGISQLLEGDRLIGTRMMILAASLSEESAFRARFTNTLLQIWGTHSNSPNECHSGETGIPAFVNQRMDVLDPLDKKFPQTVSLVFSYTNDFCIESFASGEALALLGNPTDEELKGVLHLDGGTQETIPFRVRAKAVAPVILRRKAYYVDVAPVFSSSSRKANSITLDFTSDFVQYQPLYSSEGLESAIVQKQAADYAEAFGASSEKVSGLVNSAEKDVRTALASIQANAGQVHNTVAAQKAKLQDAENEKQTQDIAAADAGVQLSQTEQQIRQKHHINDIVFLNEASANMSSGEIQKLNAAQARAQEAQKKSALASQKAADEKERLSAVEATQASIESQIAQINMVLTGFEVSAHRLELQRQARSTLLHSISTLFPTEDTPRGLIVALPADTSPLQIHSLGKILASGGSGILVEPEVLATGQSYAKNRQVAGELASSLRKELLRDTGLSPERVVPRGFSGTEHTQKVTKSIVVSGDLIGK